jgi:hypothetical protein
MNREWHSFRLQAYDRNCGCLVLRSGNITDALTHRYSINDIANLIVQSFIVELYSRDLDLQRKFKFLELTVIDEQEHEHTLPKITKEQLERKLPS